METVDGTGHSERDGTAFRGELDRVRQEVVEELREAGGIEPHPERVAFCDQIERDALSLRRYASRFDRLVRHRHDVDPFALERKPARVDASDKEDVVDQPVEAVAIAVDDLQESPLL